MKVVLSTAVHCSQFKRQSTRIALVHDWLTGMRGGELVLEAIAELFPQAELFTLLCFPKKISPVLAQLKSHVSWLQKVPGIEKKYRYFLPLMPAIIESFDLTGFDTVISSSHCVAKGIRKALGATHVSYVHAPMRYMWSRYEDYFSGGKVSFPVRYAARWMRRPLQRWDQRVSTPERIDHLIANSRFIAQEIQSVYQRKASVIYPFVERSRFGRPRQVRDFYLIVSALVPYKRIDLAVEACSRLKRPLIIIGSGPEEKRLKHRAGSTVTFLGHLSNVAIAEFYSQCKALIFPGIEDFGITPLEAMAAGAPVIAFRGGGVQETVTEKTGFFFSDALVESLIEGIQTFEKNSKIISETECRARAAEFSKERFQREFIDTLLTQQ